MVEKDSESFYAKYLRLSLPFLILIFLSMQVFALTTQDANYSGGVYNGGFEYGTGQGLTSASWIGDMNYGWYRNGSGSFTVVFNGFDNTRFKNGLQSMKYDFNSFDSGEVGYFNTGGYPGTTIPTSNAEGRFSYVFSIKSSTNYKLSFWVDVNALNWTQLTGTKQPVPVCIVTQYNSAGTRLNNISLLARTLTTTGGSFVYLSDFGVTEATAAIGILSCGVQTSSESGTFSDGNGVVWFDDVRLEEVGSVNLSGQSQGRPTILVTGVSDFNAIDQADTNNGTTVTLGRVLADSSVGQCVTPIQRKFNGLIFQRGANTGTFTGDVIVSLRDSNGTHPIGNPLVSVTIPNAIWNAYATSTDYKIELPYDLNAKGINKYCFDFNSTTNDVNNYTRLRMDSASGYSGGTLVFYNGSNWILSTNDLYFKTLFEKQTSAIDVNVCSSGDSVCESKTYDFDDLNNGETYTISPSDAPLFYLGDNNVYFMMHSDSDYNNKTPSMMAKLQYTFDKPTTTYTLTNYTTSKKLNFTCISGTTGTCTNTYVTINGTTYTNTYEFTLNGVGEYNITYYSTDDQNNTETPRTITESITSSTITRKTVGSGCGIISSFSLFGLLIIVVLGFLAMSIFITKDITMSVVVTTIVALIIGAVILVFGANIVGIACNAAMTIA